MNPQNIPLPCRGQDSVAQPNAAKAEISSLFLAVGSTGSAAKLNPAIFGCDAELGIQPHICEACINHVSGHRAGIVATYNLAEYKSEKRQDMDIWADHVASIVAGTPEKVIAVQFTS